MQLVKTNCASNNFNHHQPGLQIYSIGENNQMRLSEKSNLINS